MIQSRAVAQLSSGLHVELLSSAAGRKKSTIVHEHSFDSRPVGDIIAMFLFSEKRRCDLMGPRFRLFIGVGALLYGFA